MTELNSKGFAIATDINRRLLRLRLWGLWDADLVKKYKSALTEKIKEIQKNGKEWYALADFTRLYPRSEEVQDMLRNQIGTAKEQGMKKIVYLGEGVAIQLRLNRLFPVSSLQEYSFAESEEEAIRWLLNELPHQ